MYRVCPKNYISVNNIGKAINILEARIEPFLLLLLLLFSSAAGVAAAVYIVEYECICSIWTFLRPVVLISFSLLWSSSRSITMPHNHTWILNQHVDSYKRSACHSSLFFSTLTLISVYSPVQHQEKNDDDNNNDESRHTKPADKMEKEEEKKSKHFI